MIIYRFYFVYGVIDLSNKHDWAACRCWTANPPNPPLPPPFTPSADCYNFSTCGSGPTSPC